MTVRVAARSVSGAKPLKSAAALYPAGYASTIQSADPDDLGAAAVGWNQEYTQLGAGRFFGKIVVAHTAQMQMGRVSWNTAVQARGHAPQGARSIAVPVGPHPAPYFCGSAIPGNEIVTGEHGNEIDFRSAKSCEFLMISISLNLLQRLSAAFWGAQIESRIDDGRMNLGNAAARDKLARSWSTTFAKVQRDPAVLTNPLVARMVEQSVIISLLEVAAPPARQTLPARRRQLARRAEEYLRERIEMPITLLDVCESVGASQRSLHLGFLERFGMSPMAYLKVLRLNRIRRQLRDAATGVSVTDLALRARFSHLGRFAIDYARFFGEHPSNTLWHLESDPKALPA